MIVSHMILRLTCIRTRCVRNSRGPLGALSETVFQHDYNVRSKPALLTEIQRHTRKGRGLAVRALKDSWKEAPQAIEELEKEGEVFVTRTAKDGQLRMVFYNEVKGDNQGPIEVEKGETLVSRCGLQLFTVSIEFVDLWHSLKVPNETDLLKDLASGMLTHPPDIPVLILRNRGIAGYCCRSHNSENRTKEEGDVIRSAFAIIR